MICNFSRNSLHKNLSVKGKIIPGSTLMLFVSPYMHDGPKFWRPGTSGVQNIRGLVYAEQHLVHKLAEK